MSTPKISVYVVSHNYGHFVEAAIKSVLRQSMDDWELLIIDDGSTDDTWDVIQRFVDNDKVQAFRTENIGLARAANLALSKSRGGYIIRLDGDDVFCDDILLVLSNYLDRHSEKALVFADYYLIDDEGDITAVHHFGSAVDDDSLLRDPPHGAGTMIRKMLLVDQGGYRENVGAQDGADMYLKLRSSHAAGHIATPLFKYRRHGNNLTNNVQRVLSARRKFKRDMSLESLSPRRPVIAVIPVRRHHDFVENLWSQKIGGISLLERDICTCLSSTLFDYVAVTCDNPEAEKIVDNVGDDRLRFFLRKPAETSLHAGLKPALIMIAADLDPERQGAMAVRFIQTPFVTTDVLEEAIATLVLSDCDSACGVEPIFSDIYTSSGKGLIRQEFDNHNIQSRPKAFRDTNTCLAFWSRNFSGDGFLGHRQSCFEVSAAESFFVNSHDKLWLAARFAEKIDVDDGS